MSFYRPPSLQEALDALGGVYRALRAWNFYPKGHPTRKTSVLTAHECMVRMLNGNDLNLTCGRAGFSFPDGEELKDSTRMSSSLSYELFIRRVQKITFLGDLYQEDLLDFLRLLTLTPEAVYRAGGLDQLMADHGIRTIWLNEFDLSVIKRKRQEVESTGVTPQGMNDLEGVSEEATAPAESLHPEHELQTILGRLISATDADIYMLHVRQALGCADALVALHQLEPLVPLVELLATHTDENRERSAGARFGLEHLVNIPELLSFVLEHADDPHGVSRDTMLPVMLSAGPAGVVATVEKIGATDSIALRKTLTMLLVRLGEPVVSPILGLMQDERWYIIRNLAAILGDIGSREAVPELQKCLRHSDVRVCKEAIRSLAKIGGKEAEQAIITVMRDNMPALLPQAISSLGGMKSHKALSELLKIACEEDLFLKNLAIKIEAVSAIALIGDRQATPYLITLLDSRHLFARQRWEQYKIAIAACLGKLGDVRALGVLRKKRGSSGELGRVCDEAATTIERIGGSSDGST